MFVRFDRIHERDRQTHWRTPHDNIGCACIASSGKKHCFLILHSSMLCKHACCSEKCRYCEVKLSQLVKTCKSYCKKFIITFLWTTVCSLCSLHYSLVTFSITYSLLALTSTSAHVTLQISNTTRNIFVNTQHEVINNVTLYLQLRIAKKQGHTRQTCFFPNKTIC